MNNQEFQIKIKRIAYSSILFCCSLMLIGFFLLLVYLNVIPLNKFGTDLDNSYVIDLDFKEPYQAYFDVSLLDDSEDNLEIKFGYELFKNTPNYIGPNNDNLERAYAGNNLSCNNCHLYAGTKKYAGPLIGIIQRFPQFRGRENKIGTIEERINGCMERSMNGRVMPTDSKEMKAIISYMKWLGREAPEDGKFEGTGFLTIEIPERPVDLTKGKSIFNNMCSVCHGINGDGEKLPNSNVYKYPPLWGDDSFNNGAGMNRVITAANFIKGNMPFGTTYDSPVLTDEEAYDVAGYINQQLRPTKQNLELDFPDLKRKPVSTPYPPYVDDFSIEQHQLGPFQPIMEFYKMKYNMIKKK
jgi:thiosulfate dehydrogenase